MLGRMTTLLLRIRPSELPPRRFSARFGAKAVAKTVGMALAVLLSACGGGGDAPGAAAPTASTGMDASSPPVVETTTTAPPTVTAAGSRETCGLADFQAEALRLINAYRAAGAQCGSSGSFGPTTPLTWNNTLTQAALVHAEDMLARNYFSHTGSDGSNPGDRATAAGYPWSALGENIAAGYPTVAVVVAGWMNSPGHCANLMQPAFREIGMVCLSGNANSRRPTYWAQSLGASR